MKPQAKAAAAAQDISSLKALLRLFSLMLLFLAAIGAFVLDMTRPEMTSKLRMQVLELASPMLAALSNPMQAVRDAGDSFRQFLHANEENTRLREENRRLLHWQDVAVQLMAENAALRTLAEAAPEGKMQYITARVIGQTAGPMVQSLLLNAGTADGLRRGQAVLNEQGMIGRIVEVAEHTAQVMPVTAIASRVPVMTSESHERAILAGDHPLLPQLLYLPIDSHAVAGEIVSTTGEGQVLPAGLPVGVLELGNSGAPRLRTFVDWTRLDYVRVLHSSPAAP